MNYSFIHHLEEHGLLQEQLAYLDQPHGSFPVDSVHYLKAKYYLRYFNDSLFMLHYAAAKSLVDGDSCLYSQATAQFLGLNSAAQTKWFTDGFAGGSSSHSLHMFMIYKASLDPRSVPIQNIPAPLQDDLLLYKKYYSRKPVVAGLLSAVVPGLGKLYAGRKRAFPVVFLSSLINGIQSYESIKKLGYKNPYTLFTLGLSGVFYFANIYGSFHDLVAVKKERKKQFLIDARSYYLLNAACSH